jgi:acetylornithine/N-succinyldiaminopimelate aminotransferase
VKEVLSPPASAIVQNETKRIRELFDKFVIPSYSRFDLALERGEGSYVWDVDGKRYLDLASGIAVCSLGHAHPEITKALTEQSRKLIHVSNLYYNEPQGQLAKRIVEYIAPGHVFFCNSGAEANEGLFKLARKFGYDNGRYEIITTTDSFHGRTLAGIAATGQEKVKRGFAPAVEGFSQVPFNDLKAMRNAITSKTAAILVEPVQGESGVTVANAEYLAGLRQLCDENNLLLLFDEVQAGHFRTGKFQSWQRILEAGAIDPNRSEPDWHYGGSVNRPYLPDAVSMAKSLGGGFPIGAFWVREKFANVFSAGTHASTFGGTPLACAVALKIFDVIERDNLVGNARETGEFLLGELQKIQIGFPKVVKVARGFGFMIGIEFQQNFKAVELVKNLHQRNVLTVPAGASVVRLLPALTLRKNEAEEGLRAIESLVVDLARQNLD